MADLIRCVVRGKMNLPGGGRVPEGEVIEVTLHQYKNFRDALEIVKDPPPLPILRNNPPMSRFEPRTKEGPEIQGLISLEWTGPVTVACVLRPSKDFSVNVVELLYRQCRRWLSRMGRFVCLTEESEMMFSPGIEVVPLLHPEWATKHSKLELFRPELLEDWGRVLYMDLDTILCGDLNPLVSYAGRFAMLIDVNFPDNPGSGVMLWGPDRRMSEIYYDFLRMPPGEQIRKYPIGGGRGDQLFIRNHTPYAPHYIQDFFSGAVSFKKHFRGEDAPPDMPLSMVYFHGRPKPFEAAMKYKQYRNIFEPWLKEYCELDEEIKSVWPYREEE